MPAWIIVERVDGYVDSRVPGQIDWSPIFRLRRVTAGAGLKVHEGAVCRINFADRSWRLVRGLRWVFFVDNDQPRPPDSHDALWINADLTPRQRAVVSRARGARVRHDVEKALGVKQERFDIRASHPGNPGAGTMAPRG